MHAPHLVREHERHRGHDPQRQLEDEQRKDEEAGAGQPGVALEAPPRPAIRQRFSAAAFTGAAGASATASVTPSTWPACSASAT